MLDKVCLHVLNRKYTRIDFSVGVISVYGIRSGPQLLSYLWI
ncbi:unnamed protein product [Debaryomyces tyrocola]|nr:unnamed protein product [Debaryomyces tyrocola]